MVTRMQLVSRISAALLACAIIAGTSIRESVAAELSRTPFSKFDGKSCPSASCSIDFGTVPGGAKRRYEITHISCTVSIGNANGRLSAWHLGAYENDDLVAAIHLRPHYLGVKTLPVATRYTANEQTNLVVRGGRQLIVGVYSTAGNIYGTDCTVSGYDVRLQ